MPIGREPFGKESSYKQNKVDEELLGQGYSYGISRWSDINNDSQLDLAITGNLYTGSSKTQIYMNDDGILNVDSFQNCLSCFNILIAILVITKIKSINANFITILKTLFEPLIVL